MASSVASAARASVQACCPCASLEPKGPAPTIKGVSLAPFIKASSSTPLKFASNGSRVNMSASKERRTMDMGSTTAALAVLVAAIVPEFAEAAQPGVSSSLKNLLLSVVAGGVVLAAIGSAVAAVSTFDPVKRK